MNTNEKRLIKNNTNVHLFYLLLMDAQTFLSYSSDKTIQYENINIFYYKIEGRNFGSSSKSYSNGDLDLLNKMLSEDAF